MDYDVIVIGAGHAGCEAAAAAARLGASTALITQRLDTIGAMSCNPAIGGLGKGHLVREIDALDGLMGTVTDLSGIQFRMLNASKGPAVQGPRTQADRNLYAKAMQNALLQTKGLTLLEAEVTDLQVNEGRCTGVVLANKERLTAGAVVLTTGTFLRGLIHLGSERWPAGRLGDRASNRLAERLMALNLPMGRLKTGTPPRLNRGSIDWDRLEMQYADAELSPFSMLTERIEVPQIACAITYTNETSHAVIADHRDQVPLYNGQISGKGPRYCPSIEDKVIRFPQKSRHQIFLEPEGLESDQVYPNGISTSLPKPLQEQLVHSIVGLEKAEILQHGYAIEYDYINPTALDARLALKALNGLFLAGQINGTTGYEEAAAQGIIAGLNAALEVEGAGRSFVLDRADAYIGVMIDDLITRGVDEPYRMFTSRAEYRLSIRADNADRRLTDKAIALGAVSQTRRRAWTKKKTALETAFAAMQSIYLSPTAWAARGYAVKLDGIKRTALDMLAYDSVTLNRLNSDFPGLRMLLSDPKVAQQVEIEALYSGYLERQQEDVTAFRRSQAFKLSSSLDYQEIPELSNEIRQRLTDQQPTTLGEASRIPGMTPVALSILMRHARPEVGKSL